MRRRRVGLIGLLMLLVVAALIWWRGEGDGDPQLAVGRVSGSDADVSKRAPRAHTRTETSDSKASAGLEKDPSLEDSAPNQGSLAWPVRQRDVELRFVRPNGEPFPLGTIAALWCIGPRTGNGSGMDAPVGRDGVAMVRALDNASYRLELRLPVDVEDSLTDDDDEKLRTVPFFERVIQASDDPITVHVPDGARLMGNVVTTEPVALPCRRLNAYPHDGWRAIDIEVKADGSFASPLVDASKTYVLVPSDIDEPWLGAASNARPGHLTTLTLRRAPKVAFSGVVLGPDGTPVGRGVLVDARVAGVIPGVHEFRQVAWTDANGRFEIPRAADLAWQLAAGGSGSKFAPSVDPGLHRPGSPVPDFHLKVGAVLSGRARTRSGRPATGARVLAYPPGSIWGSEGHVDAKGEFRIPGLPPGRVELFYASISPEQFLGTLEVPSEDVDILLPR